MEFHIDYCGIFFYNKLERTFGIVITKGDKRMSKYEVELLRLVRENDNPEQALKTAVETILEYLRQHGSFRQPSAGDQ